MADPNQSVDPKQYDKARDAAKELRDVLQETLGIQKSSRQILKDSVNDLEREIKAYDKVNAKVETLKTSTINIKELENQIKNVQQKKFINELKLADIQKEAAKRDERKEDLLRELNRREVLQQNLISAGNRKAADLVQIGIDKQREKIGMLEEVKRLSIEEAEKIVELNDVMIKKIQEQLALEKELYKQLGFSGKALGVLASKLGLGSSVLEAMVQHAKNLTAKNKEVSKWDTFVVGVKAAGKAFKDNLTDPALQFAAVMGAQKAIFNGIVNLVKKGFELLTGWNSKIFEFGKNLGIGESESRAMMSHFLDMANTSGNLFLNTKGISETYTQMSDSLGFMAPKNEEMLQTATLLQRQFGLSAEQLQSITENSALSGQTFKDTFDTINGIGMAEGAANKLVMSQKQMMADISKVSSLVLLNFKGNVPALASAVVTAKKLGMSLNDVAATTNGYLDFESSISKEFEAQLLTGKDLNLQKLRYLALTHDTKGMMDEIGKRIPSMLEFEHMNTIERQSYAEAMNMSEEGMAEIIKRQEVARKLGIDQNTEANQMYDALVKQNLTHDQIVDKMKEAGAQQYLTASITDRWDNVIEGIKDTLGRMLEGEMVDIITSFELMIKNAGGLSGIMNTIKGVVHSIAGFFEHLPENVESLMHKAGFYLGLVGAAQMLIGAGVALIPGLEGAGAGIMVGGGMMLAAGIGVGASGGMVADALKPGAVGQSALNNQVGAPAAATGAGTAAAGQTEGQPVNVNVLVQNSYDGEKAAPINAKYQQWAITDNKGGNLSPSHNTANSGQTH